MYKGKRICIFVQTLSGGGSERAMLNLMHQFVGREIAVDLVMTRRAGEYLDLVPKEVTIIDLGTGVPRASIGALSNYLKTVQPDAMISSIANASIVALVARRVARVPTKVAVSIQNTLSAELSGNKGMRHGMINRSVRWFYPMADLIACVSTGVADDLAEVTGIPREKIDVVYNPVITDSLFERAKEPLDHPWFAEGQPPVILSVGRLAPQKDQTVMIEAFAKLRKRRPCRLLILGQGSERERLESLIADLKIGDDVSLPGFAPNPYAYMSRAAAFTLSSRWEGLPTVLIEALACGTPVVSTRCPSGPDEILAEGKYGWLTPMGDSAALANALDEALDAKTPPPAESWHPYRDTVSADRYCSALLGGESR